MKTELEVFSDLSERLAYNKPDFPLYAVKGYLESFDHFTATCHWHADLEYIVIREGSMDYYVNGRIVSLHAGEGIFVNSKRLHFGFSSDRNNCVFLVIAFNSSFFSEHAGFLITHWDKKFGRDTEDFIHLTHIVSWQESLLSRLEEIFAGMNSGDTDPFLILSLVLKVCQITAEHLSRKEKSDPVIDESWLIVRKMTDFIHRNYDRKISLEDIAHAGAVCRSRCCGYFIRYLSQTPVDYLNHYRLRKCRDMLAETHRSMTEIAFACGFQSTSYFTSVFRKMMGLTPRAYRKLTGKSVTV